MEGGYGYLMLVTVVRGACRMQSRRKGRVVLGGIPALIEALTLSWCLQCAGEGNNGARA